LCRVWGNPALRKKKEITMNPATTMIFGDLLEWQEVISKPDEGPSRNSFAWLPPEGLESG